jgi:hypothetical protein
MRFYLLTTDCLRIEIAYKRSFLFNANPHNGRSAMPRYEFQGNIYHSDGAILDAIAEAWMTANGSKSPNKVLHMLQNFDEEELVDECIKTLGMDQPDPHESKYIEDDAVPTWLEARGIERDNLIEAFYEFRKNFTADDRITQVRLYEQDKGGLHVFLLNDPSKVYPDNEPYDSRANIEKTIKPGKMSCDLRSAWKDGIDDWSGEEPDIDIHFEEMDEAKGEGAAYIIAEVSRAGVVRTYPNLMGTVGKSYAKDAEDAEDAEASL